MTDIPNPFGAVFAKHRRVAHDPRQMFAVGVAEGCALAKTAIQQALGEEAYKAVHARLAPMLITTVITAAAFANETAGRELAEAYKDRLTPPKTAP